MYEMTILGGFHTGVCNVIAQGAHPIYIKKQAYQISGRQQHFFSRMANSLSSSRV
jgi:hypothetical protein